MSSEFCNKEKKTQRDRMHSYDLYKQRDNAKVTVLYQHFLFDLWFDFDCILSLSYFVLMLY